MECTNIAKTHSRAWGAAISVIAISLVGAVAVGRLLSNPHAATADTPAIAPSGARFGSDQHPGAGAAGQAAHDSHCASCGTVASIRDVWVDDDATDTGAIAGGARNARKRHSYRVTVHMDDGLFRTLSQPSAPSIIVGERVRVANGAVLAQP